MKTANILAVIAMLLAYLSTHISPETAPALALFGIAYGFILLINIGFIIFWLLVKKRMALLSAITILVGFNHMSAYFQIFPSFSEPTEGQKTLHVLSHNVRLFNWYSWRTNRDDLNDMIRNLEVENPELMCFQEYFHNTGPDIFETREIIKQTVGATYLHEEYVNVLYQEQHYGIATFSKHPIVNKGVIRFNNDHGNVCIFSDIVAHGDTIRVYNAHVASIRFKQDDYKFVEEMRDENQKEKPPISDGLGIIKRLSLAYKKRAEQVHEIADHIATCPYPVIVCGDFNDTPVSFSYNILDENLQDSFREGGWGIGNTYIGKFPSFRIDYIFHSEEMSAHQYKTLDEKVSDHHAISTVLAWD